MSSIKCWLCGHEVDLAQVNLLITYERYLVLTFFLSVLIRFRQYQNNVRFAWQFPQQWPSVFEVIKQHSGIFLKWTMLLPVGITLGILLMHTLSLRLVWSEAVVTPLELREHAIVLALLLVVSLWMVALDFRTLFTASQMDFAEIEGSLSKGEFALTSRSLSALRFATLGLFNPRKYVESQVADSLRNVRLALLVQLRRWSFHTAVRITFGFLLWFGYARLNGRIRLATFLGYAAILAVWLGAAFWWSRRSDITHAIEAEGSDHEEEADGERLTEVLDQVVENTDASEVSLREILNVLEHRSYGPLLLLPALVAVSPVGAVPGMSLVTSSIILLVSLQILMGKTHPWLPDRLLKFRVSREKLTSSMGKVTSKIRWVEKLIHQRWTKFTQPPVLQVLAVVCIVLAAMFLPLAVVPFGVAVPGGVIALFALGLTARDGVLILLAFIATFASAGIMIAPWPF